MLAELTRRAHDEIGTDATPLDYVVLRVENGATILDLAAELSAATGEEITRSNLSLYVNEQENSDARLSRARARGAHAIVEAAVSIADEGGETREALQHAKQRTDVRLWLAERWNRDELGARNGPQLTLNIGSLHLDALRARELPALQPGPDAIASAIAEHVEVLSDDAATT